MAARFATNQGRISSMGRTYLTIALVTSTLVSLGCGKAAKSVGQGAAGPRTAAQASLSAPSKRTPPLTRAQLIAKGDAICYRLNARRASTRIDRPADYERLVPALAAYELAGASEMSTLTPPPALAQDWRRMVEGARTIAQATARIRNARLAGSKSFAEAIEPVLYKGIEELTGAAKSAGFKECSRFP